MNTQAKLMIGAGLALAALAIVAYRRGAGQIGADVGGAAVDLASGAVGGVVNTVGEIIGIPKTECGACTKAMDEYAAASSWERAWLSFKVSANCTAADYFKWLQDWNYRPGCTS